MVRLLGIVMGAVVKQNRACEHAENLFAQVQIIQFLCLDLHTGVVPLDGKVARLHRRHLFGEQFRCFSRRLARFPQPSGVAVALMQIWAS